MFKLSKSKFGGNLGKTTGWIHCSTLKNKKVQFINNVQYTKIDDEGLHYVENEAQKVLAVDSIVICACQLPFAALLQPIEAKGIKRHAPRCADFAIELDVKRTIKQAIRLVAKI